MKIGLRKREAEARCAGLVVLDADPVAEARAFEILARAIEPVTPAVVLERPGVLSFPTRGPSRYFGGDDGLCTRVLEAVQEVGTVETRVGIADGAFAARLAARTAGASASAVIPREGRPSSSPRGRWVCSREWWTTVTHSLSSWNGSVCPRSAISPG